MKSLILGLFIILICSAYSFADSVLKKVSISNLTVLAYDGDASTNSISMDLYKMKEENTNNVYFLLNFMVQDQMLFFMRLENNEYQDDTLDFNYIYSKYFLFKKVILDYLKKNGTTQKNMSRIFFNKYQRVDFFSYMRVDESNNTNFYLAITPSKERQLPYYFLLTDTQIEKILSELNNQ